MMSSATFPVYLGTYTSDKEGGSKGIYAFELDGESGGLTPHLLAGEAKKPGFLAQHPGGGFLYAVSEVEKDADGKPGGGVLAFSMDPETRALTRISTERVNAKGPCHLAVDSGGRIVAVANYSSGSVSVFPVNANGGLDPMSDQHQHSGSGPNKDRQEGPHAHGITFSPDDRFVLVPDLGIDQVVVYQVDYEAKKLLPHSAAKAKGGAGPRHITFAPDGAFAYCVNELDNTVDAFRWDAGAGELDRIQTLPMLPGDFTAYSKAAEIEVHPSGRFVYASNRGFDSIAVYTRDPATGRLEAAGHVMSGGSEPRSFALSPDGRWLIAAAHYDETLQVFAVDQESGQLTPRSAPVPSKMPVCVLFAK